MGRKDASMKTLLSKNEVFADACNQYFFRGKNVVKPESLRELDPTEIVLPFGKEDKEATANQKYRDILKLCTVKTDSKCTYCIIGMEAQSKIHYAMPVRNLLYDAMHLTKQVADKAKQHKEERTLWSIWALTPGMDLRVSGRCTRRSMRNFLNMWQIIR